LTVGEMMFCWRRRGWMHRRPAYVWLAVIL